MTIPLGNSLRLRLNLQVQSLIFLSWVFLSTEKAYSFFPRSKNLKLALVINMLLLHGLNPRPLLHNISFCLIWLWRGSMSLWIFTCVPLIFVKSPCQNQIYKQVKGKRLVGCFRASEPHNKMLSHQEVGASYRLEPQVFFFSLDLRDILFDICRNNRVQCHEWNT